MRVISKNKRARFDYEIVDTMDAGIVLVWHEVKSIKIGKINISDAVVRVDMKWAWVLNMDVPLYGKTNPNTVPAYEAKWRRKLLLTKQQITRLAERTKKTGLTILPLQIYEAANRKIKLTIGLGKRKKKIEKRSSIKERETKRQMEKEAKNY